MDGQFEPVLPPRYAVHESPTIRVFSRIFDPGGPVFVSFSIRNERPMPFGEAVFLKYGLNAVHVVACGPHWYQYEDSPAAARAIRAHVAPASRVITYGTSMGGYAALMFSGDVGADLALSFSPQFSVDGAKVPFETRWRDDAEAILRRGGFVYDDMAQGLTRTGRVVVAYDPLDDDGLHVACLRPIRPFEELIVPFSQHRTIRVLAEARLASWLLREAASGTLDIGEARRRVRGGRHASSTYLRYLGRRLQMRGAPAALGLLRQAADLTRDDDTEALESDVALLLRAGDEARALAQYLRLLRLEPSLARPGSVRDFMRHAKGLIAHGHAAAAGETLAAAIGGFTGPARFHAMLMSAVLHARSGDKLRAAGALLALAVEGGAAALGLDGARLLEELGLEAEALRVAEALAKAEPGNPDIAYFRACLLERLGRHAAALAVYQEADQARPLPATPHCFRMGQLFRWLERPEDALAAFERALEQAPHHINTLRARGEVLAQLGRHREACDVFRAVVAIEPGNAAAFDGLARSRAILGDHPGALDAARRGVAADPKRAGLVRLITELEAVG